MSTTRIVKLADALPCCAREGWDYCNAPATTARAELRQLATGHHWELRPYCEKHARRIKATEKR